MQKYDNSSTTHNKNRKKPGRKRGTRRAKAYHRTTFAVQTILADETVTKLELLRKRLI